ncbi:DNA (cytosine-5-)-methyltransferase, partial [Streptomyces sp. NPDC045470]|uniref:DNA cytosine methyltransferase n=1 Tax=Streptomyces sp. NPDC045470 TaxID=3155469 RepID=UPI003402C599
MPIAELCAGYGGLGMAVGTILQDHVAYVAEIDPHASQILAARYPHAPNIGDITLYDWSRLSGEVDVITAGFPCQGISNAGLRKGLDDERSGIWRDVAQAIRVVRPRIAFLENVASIKGRGLDQVVSDLAAIGYDAEWTCLRASAVGAPHHRDRWFCIAIPEDADGESFRQWWRSAPRETQKWEQICGGGGADGQPELA